MIRKDEPFEQWWRAVGFRELRQLLLWRWDPVGVADFFPATEDEYDMYARPLAELLGDGGDAAAVTGYLEEIERDAMNDPGVAATPELGEAIFEWYDESRQHYAGFGDSWARLQDQL